MSSRPVLKPEVIAYCNRVGKPIFSGSYTPTEAQTAYELGADFIKIFPADGLGPKYIQAIRGPLPHLKIVPTGGVDVNTAGDFIKAGCVAVAAGSTLVSKEILKNKDWAKLTDPRRAIHRRRRQGARKIGARTYIIVMVRVDAIASLY